MKNLKIVWCVEVVCCFFLTSFSYSSTRRVILTESLTDGEFDRGSELSMWHSVKGVTLAEDEEISGIENSMSRVVGGGVGSHLRLTIRKKSSALPAHVASQIAALEAEGRARESHLSTLSSTLSQKAAQVDSLVDLVKQLQTQMSQLTQRVDQSATSGVSTVVPTPFSSVAPSGRTSPH